MRIAHFVVVCWLLVFTVALAQNPIPVIYQPLIPVRVAPRPQFTLASASTTLNRATQLQLVVQ